MGDYNIYAYIMRPQLGAAFYYMREQCEVKAKLWQQAIVDINTAIELDKQQALYYAEKANLLLRVNMAEQAVDIARQCIASPLITVTAISFWVLPRYNSSKRMKAYRISARLANWATSRPNRSSRSINKKTLLTYK